MQSLSKKITFIILSVALLLLIPTLVLAAPVRDRIVEIPNSYIDENGELQEIRIQVTVTGDEYYTEVRTLDGYTLIRDKDTGSICYAYVNNKGKLASTKVPYTGLDIAPEKIAEIVLSKEISESQEAVEEKIVERKAIVGDVTGKNNQRISNLQKEVQNAPQNAQKYRGDIKGLTIIINFQDVKSNYTKAEIENFCNGREYTQNGNVSSVNKYFSDISGGKLNYTNTVVEYTAMYNKSYYTDPLAPEGEKVIELFVEVIDYLIAENFDFNSISKDEEGAIRAINLLYAGAIENVWGEGLWPGNYTFYEPVLYQGQKFITFQITDLSPNSLYIGTFCHENGHMILELPDTYSYVDPSQASLGFYDLMAGVGFSDDPSTVNPYFRTDVLGWEEATIINSSGIINISANQIGVHKIRINGNTEFFLIENVKAEGRWFSFLTSGLYIWHIDTTKEDNNEIGMTAEKHWMVSLEQADGRFDLETANREIGYTYEGGGGIPRAYGDSGDAYRAGYVTEFTPTTTPNTNSWNGEDSGISVTDISTAGNTMQYTVTLPEREEPASITLGNITSVPSILREGTGGNITLPINTSGINNGSLLNVNIKRGSTNVTSNFTITGNTVNSDGANLSIVVPASVTIGNYTVEVSYGDVPVQTKAFSVSSPTGGETEPTFSLGNVTYNPNPIRTGTGGTVNLTVTTSNIQNGNTLNITIKKGSTNVTNDFTITGSTVNNNSANILINVRPSIAAGSYTIEVGYGTLPVQTKTFSVSDSTGGEQQEAIGKMTLTIKDTQGRPIQGVRVRVIENGIRRSPDLTTNTQGQVTIENMVMGSEYSVNLFKTGYIEQTEIELAGITSNGQVLIGQLVMELDEDDNNNNSNNNTTNNNSNSNTSGGSLKDYPDNTVAQKDLPKTGENIVYIGTFNILVSIAVVSFIKMKELTGI